MDVWYIDLEDRDPVISKYEERYLEMDLADAETKDPMDLDDPDWRVFTSIHAAGNFLHRYREIKERLEANRIITDKTFGLRVPHMLCKRRYIVQTLMGVKNQTYRHYKKDWKPGQLINLHDQTHFLTVRIKSITKVGQEWKYEFEVA